MRKEREIERKNGNNKVRQKRRARRKDEEMKCREGNYEKVENYGREKGGGKETGKSVNIK
jgi:hypothetical protein